MMQKFEVAFSNDFDDFVTISAFSISEAVESASCDYCHENADFADFNCHARIAGDVEWIKFNVLIESSPVFHAIEAKGGTHD